MGLISKLFGSGIDGAATGIAKVVGIFTPNKEKQSERDANARAASMGQYASEFNVHAQRNWFDSFVDGANRLVRPILAFHVILFFDVVFFSQDLALSALQSLTIVPTGMWALLSIIVTFYFGGRMHLKHKQFVISKKQMDAAKAIGELRKKNADTVTASEYVEAMADTEKPLPNSVVMDWNKRNEEQ